MRLLVTVLFALLVFSGSAAGKQFVDVHGRGTCDDQTITMVGTRYGVGHCNKTIPCKADPNRMSTVTRYCVDDAAQQPRLPGQKMARVTFYEGNGCSPRNGNPRTIRVDLDGNCAVGQKTECTRNKMLMHFYNSQDCAGEPYKTSEFQLNACIEAAGRRVKYTCV